MYTFGYLRKRIITNLARKLHKSQIILWQSNNEYRRIQIVSLKSIEGDQISQDVKVDESHNYQSYIVWSFY